MGIAAALLSVTLLLTGCPAGDGEPVDEPEQEQAPANPGEGDEGDDNQGDDQADDDQGDE
jgi:hypothetical protein